MRKKTDKIKPKKGEECNGCIFILVKLQMVECNKAAVLNSKR